MLMRDTMLADNHTLCVYVDTCTCYCTLQYVYAQASSVGAGCKCPLCRAAFTAGDIVSNDELKKVAEAAAEVWLLIYYFAVANFTAFACAVACPH
jgi:hypothetical protein